MEQMYLEIKVNREKGISKEEMEQKRLEKIIVSEYDTS